MMLRALLPCFLLSCSSFDADDLSVPSPADREGNGEDTGSGGGGEDTADWDETGESVPAWFALHGKVVLDDGLLLSMSLSLDVYEEEASEGKIEDCTVEVEDSEWETPEALPDAQIYAWWKFLTLDVSSDACGVRDRLPPAFYLGLGSLHPDLTPELVALEMDNPEQYLYGAFASFAEPDADGQQDIYVFGVAGTQDNLDQDSEVAQTAPLPSGTYYITAVYLFPLLD